MRLDLVFQVSPEQSLGHCPIVPDIPTRQPTFVELFQQIINGLHEQIALVDDAWNILAVNNAWIQAAALFGNHELAPGMNYLEYCNARAEEGHSAAAITVDGILEMEQADWPSFRFTYHGSDRWEGRAFQLCINRLNLVGRTFATITRYDVSELVNLRQMREEFSHSLIEHQAQERRRIAREVHDSTMQLLAGVGLSLGQLKRSRGPKASGGIMDEMERMLGEAQRELRTISYLAHPPALSELGLAKALQQLTEGFGRRTALSVSLHIDEQLCLSPAAEVAVYRMVQEALSNVHRHAHATDALVGLYQRRSIVHVAVVDNGVGMPANVPRGVGLSSMQARIAEFGGRLTIRSGSPGTILIASMPAQAEIRAVGGTLLPGSEANATQSRLWAWRATHGLAECIPAA